MTISTTYSPDTYTGDGSTTTFAITFDFGGIASNIKVSVEDATTNALVVQTASTHYNVSGTDVVFTGGNIPANGLDIAIELETDYLQSTDFRENDILPAETLEDTLDKLTLTAQSLNERVGRAVLTSVLDATLGTLGTIATQNSNAVTITGGAISGITDLALADGGTGASTAAAARTNLGLGTMATQASSSVSITGGTITATTIDINGLTEDTNPDEAADFVITYDNNAAVNKKVLLTNLVTAASDLVDDTSPQLGGDLDLNGNNIDFATTANISDCLDEDNMVSDSATKLATQQSIKAYIDTEVGNFARTIPIHFLSKGSSSGNMIANNTYGVSMSGRSAAGLGDADEERVLSIPIPTAGTIKNLYLAANVAPGSSESYTCTVRKNAADTAVTATISDTSKTASDTGNSVSVSAGDYILLKVVLSSSAATLSAISVALDLELS